MRFTDNPELNYSNMDGADILAGTDVSVSPTADRKFTLAGLAKWILETYTGTSLGGAAQSVKSAVDSLFAGSSSTFTFSLGGWTISTPIVKRGRVVEWTIGSGGTTFASFVPGSTVGTIPAGYRPSTMVIGSGFCRTEAGWTAVTMAPIQFVITSDGDIKAYGNQAAIRACSYLWFTVVWSL